MLLKEIHMHSRTIHRFIDQKTANESSLAELARNQPGLLHKDRSDLGREPITPLDENPDNDGRQDPPKPGFVATLSAPDQHGDEGELITSVPPPPVERIASAPMITFGSDDQPRARSPSASGSILKKPVALSPTSGTGSRQPPSPTGSILRNPLLTPGPSGTGSRPPPSPTGSILKSPATVSGKANDGFPFPSVSPGGSVMRAASQHLDISTPPPRIPTLSFMRRQSAVRFDGHDDSDDDNRAPTPQILERGSSLRDDVGDDPQRSVDIGPITLSESQEQSGEEEYLKEDVPDPDMEHKLARMESRYGNWDVEHGPGVKNTIRRAMHTMVRRETSASLVFGGGGGSSAGGSNSRPHRRSPSPLADMETTHSRDKDSMHRPIRLQSLNTSTDDARSEASHQQSLESVGGGDGELLRQASTNTAEGTDLSDGAGLIQKKKSALPTDLMRLQTLPVHPQYISPTFRSIPTWFPVRARVVAWCLLGITGGVTIGNVVVALTGT
ncbi:uncharacterized protein EV422DRAFT_305819 [Fimicolochytrium jonesii]|uniref:uncharacterized protein n=1 Tax=Fimicolochytrium jonesii TaxID=1396493 RepID=UPI0022FE1555|nr:uncharacterized protein EV422DRAFT_305819 [Fimicolochytrium jonesii]KAI8824077.1 hypothetical protein EV422DRAFT_305819 [Fimicolochytrium jonesii]